MTEDQIKLAILNVFKAATSIEMIYADQSGTKPPRPYGTIRMLTDVTLGGEDEHRKTNDSGIREIVERGDMVLDMNVFQDETQPITARDLMKLFRKALNKTSVKQDLYNSSNIAIINRGVIQNLTGLLETKNEDRAQMDLRIYYTDEYTDDVGYIETVEVNEQVIGI